jgi:hypothetical protein
MIKKLSALVAPLVPNASSKKTLAATTLDFKISTLLAAEQ